MVTKKLKINKQKENMGLSRTRKSGILTNNITLDSYRSVL